MKHGKNLKIEEIGNELEFIALYKRILEHYRDFAHNEDFNFNVFLQTCVEDAIREKNRAMPTSSFSLGGMGETQEVGLYSSFNRGNSQEEEEDKIEL